jgi:hypothetical protein
VPPNTALQRYSRFLSGQYQRNQASRAAARGDRDTALRLLTSAIEVFDDSSDLESARTHTLRGQLRHTWGLGRAQDDYRLAAALLAPLQTTVEELRVIGCIRTSATPGVSST